MADSWIHRHLVLRYRLHISSHLVRCNCYYSPSYLSDIQTTKSSSRCTCIGHWLGHTLCDHHSNVISSREFSNPGSRLDFSVSSFMGIVELWNVDNLSADSLTNILSRSLSIGKREVFRRRKENLQKTDSMAKQILTSGLPLGNGGISAPPSGYCSILGS